MVESAYRRYSLPFVVASASNFQFQAWWPTLTLPFQVGELCFAFVFVGIGIGMIQIQPEPGTGNWQSSCHCHCQTATCTCTCSISILRCTGTVCHYLLLGHITVLAHMSIIIICYACIVLYPSSMGTFQSCFSMTKPPFGTIPDYLEAFLIYLLL